MIWVLVIKKDKTEQVINNSLIESFFRFQVFRVSLLFFN